MSNVLGTFSAPPPSFNSKVDDKQVLNGSYDSERRERLNNTNYSRRDKYRNPKYFGKLHDTNKAKGEIDVVNLNVFVSKSSPPCLLERSLVMPCIVSKAFLHSLAVLTQNKKNRIFCVLD